MGINNLEQFVASTPARESLFRLWLDHEALLRVVLSLFGIVTPHFLWKNFRYAILIISIIAAIITAGIGPDGTPSASIGTKAPEVAELFADSGPATPSMAP